MLSHRVMSAPDQPKPASTSTAAANTAAVLSFDDPGDFARASQGLIATHDTGRIAVGDHLVWDVSRHDFLRTDEPAPDTVHPGLWRQGKLNAIHGLFEVAENVWQARGYDLSNITFLAGDHGWVIIDPLTTAPTAKACLDLANVTLGERPVTAVIYTHSHVDHFGGVLGVTSPEAVDAGDVRIIAPDGFMHEVVGENVIAGPIMGRRAAYQFGPFLPPGPQGQVDDGLGQAIPLWLSGLIGPTETVVETGEELVIDGIRVVFQNTPDAEAPAEMNFHFPDMGLLCMAENCSHNLHNLYPIRGAQTRNALAWSKYIHEALEMWGGNTHTMFASHHWPRFGADDVSKFLRLQRDVYRWMHDQTMRLANKGHVPTEIAAELHLPAEFADESHVQGYYGTVSHNVRSVYNRYLGWYDGNPANLNPLPPVDAGGRYVQAMGGAEAVIANAQKAFDHGEYRWAAELLNHLVFADPKNQRARLLQADTLEQLGYQAESGTWRNAYLTGAQELRHGSPNNPLAVGRHLLVAATAEQLFDLVGVRFDPTSWSGGELTLNWHFTDLDEHHVLGIGRSAIYHAPDQTSADAAASLTLDRLAFQRLMADTTSLDAEVAAGAIAVDGDTSVVGDFVEALEVFRSSGLIEP